MAPCALQLPLTENLIEIGEDWSPGEPRVGKLIREAPQATVAARVRGAAAGASDSVSGRLETAAEHRRALQPGDQTSSSGHVVIENDLRELVTCRARDRDAQVLQGDLQNLSRALE